MLVGIDYSLELLLLLGCALEREITDFLLYDPFSSLRI